jgi:hypothetical protein
MIRDTRKNEEYFIKYLEYQNRRIDDFRKKAETVREDSQSKKLYLYVSGFLRDKLYASYSNGCDISELKSTYKEWLNACEKASSISYSDLIDLVSLCVLIEPGADIPARVAKLTECHEGGDGLLSNFHDYLCNSDFPSICDSIKYESYEGLQKVIESANKSQQTELLRDYIQNIWYTANSDSAWYDSHFGKQETYVGYWCFVGAAIAKLFGLNVDLFKTVDYYPVDIA